MARSSVDKAKQIVGGGVGLSNEEWEQVAAIASAKGIGKSAACRELVQKALSMANTDTKPSDLLSFIPPPDMYKLTKIASTFNKGLLDAAQCCLLVGIDKHLETPKPPGIELDPQIHRMMELLSIGEGISIHQVVNNELRRSLKLSHLDTAQPSN